MARFYSNENFPLPVVQKLRELGHDVLTIQETGRAVLTLNRLHFIRLHRHQPNHARIVVCKFDANFAAQAERIHQAIAEKETLAGQLIRVNRV